MTRSEKIAAILAALTEEQRRWLVEVITHADIRGNHVVHSDCDCSSWEVDGLQTLIALAEEFR